MNIEWRFRTGGIAHVWREWQINPDFSRSPCGLVFKTAWLKPASDKKRKCKVCQKSADWTEYVARIEQEEMK